MLRRGILLPPPLPPPPPLRWLPDRVEPPDLDEPIAEMPAAARAGEACAAALATEVDLAAWVREREFESGRGMAEDALERRLKLPSARPSLPKDGEGCGSCGEYSSSSGTPSRGMSMRTERGWNLGVAELDPGLEECVDDLVELESEREREPSLSPM